jgi:transcriptional regulator with XRE-family HTH domain
VATTFNASALSSRLKLVETKLGITRKELASKLDVKPQTFKNYIDGLALPNAKLLGDLAINFGIDLNWLLLGSGEMFATETARAVSTEQDPVLRRLEGVEAMLVRHGASPEEVRDALRMALRTLSAAGADDEVSEKPEAAVS